MTVTKTCGVDYPSPSDDDCIWTLPADDVVEFKHGVRPRSGQYQRYHEDSGWTIDALLHEDWYCWVEEFKATHPIYGTIEGDFNCDVTASSEAAWTHFIEHHPYQEFCLGDI